MIASIRIKSRIVSIVPLSLTLLAGSASAECAWVLWVQPASTKVNSAGRG